MQTPAADVEITPALVERMLRRQHPDLLAEAGGAARLTPVADGWDNVIYRLGERYAVRLPRRVVAAELVRNEQRWLPRLAGPLPVGIPVPVRVGEPDAGYPYPWSVTGWFDGTPADETPQAERSAVAAELAAFHTALHTPAPADAPHNPVRGVLLATRSTAMRTRLESGSVPHAPEVAALWEDLVSAPPWPGPALWLHGDPHPANALLEGGVAGTTGPHLVAVLDFGDITAGDPATDLAAAWLWFDPVGRAAYRARLAELGHPGLASHAEASHAEASRGATPAGPGSAGIPGDPHLWRRARGWALNMATAMTAASDDNPRMAALGAQMLRQVLLG